MVLNFCFYKIHQLLIIVNVNNKQKPFTHPTVNPFFNDYNNSSFLCICPKLLGLLLNVVLFFLDSCLRRNDIF